ncbi:MAG: hypothetical protein WC806_05065 [Candidatus Gracilibacteria bacterium]|jgi:hypothetical protein
MDYKVLIADSWNYTRKNKSLIFWLGFLPAIVTTSVSFGYAAYQFFAFKMSYLFNTKDDSFLHVVLNVFLEIYNKNGSLSIFLVVLVIVFLLLNFIIPPFIIASAIQMIARNRNGQEAGVGAGIKYGIMSFLPLFEYQLLVRTFGFFSILIEMSFVIRNLGPAIFKLLLPAFILFLFFSLILTLLLIYAEFFIVIDDVGVVDSMKKSIKLVIMNWKHTFLITVLMALIGVRIIIQAIIVFSVPALVILLTGYIATITIQSTGLIISGIITLIALILSAYLNGIVDIFMYTVWTYSFLHLTSEKELSARDKELSARDAA